MSVFPQHKYPLRSLNHIHSCPRCCPVDVLRVTCSATTKPRLNQSQLVVEPRIEMSPDQLVSPASPPLLNDPSLQSTLSHRLEPVLAGYVGYVRADLGSGVYHWGIDNYGDASTPVFGAQIETFRGHHKWPWTITRRQFANNLHALVRALTFSVLPTDLLCNNPIIHGFVALCLGCIMFSQQFHAWAHGTKGKLPPLVVALQDVALLDQHKVFEALEMVLFFKLGVRPRSWSEPSAEWTEDTETASQVAVQ
ncbi:hypothetical protein SLEP1_g3352 [Rubroshorea leprosula]|uniref:Lipid desaturase domain-containing protein n=1 Tax=Rubroshorea leprosula TaxID=152421 RepID=A0AAV5HK36_9ROSI|nr:hypothetical protein SLEP1_g3352 [Rubroshorea leprosula]